MKLEKLKNISKLNSKIKILEKDLYETQLDYFYLSSPKIPSEKINFFSNEKYKHMNYSNIYMLRVFYIKPK